MWKAIAVAMVLCVAAAGLASAQDKTVPRSLVKFAQETLVSYGQDMQLVSLVANSNANPQDVAKLRALDVKWQKKDNIESFVKTVMASAASARLGKLIGAHQYVPEAFIMDSQGTIIGETNRTSTYWKGEQEKFTGAYAGGGGAVWYGTLAFDESTKTNSVQISVPVAKGGKAIGAICFTVNVDEWEKR
jgi:thioester reductase-like protein